MFHGSAKLTVNWKGVLYLLIILIDYLIGVLAIKGQRETFN